MVNAYIISSNLWNIVRIYETFFTNGILWVIMKAMVWSYDSCEVERNEGLDVDECA
ncbi:hypothetical protein PCURB6_31030 [Paenibacillus curdlanolyticus]|nr:hypothetical protein PCURB6_31030 [Paenibacillus curdlanolyticus]